MWLDFIEKTVGHLAWPLVVICGFLIFKTPILNLSSSIRQIKYKDAEVSFKEEVTEFVEDAIELGLTVIHPDNTQKQEYDDVQLNILRGWAEIERTLEVWFEKRLHEFIVIDGLKNPTSTRARVEFLNNNEIINSSLYNLLNELRVLRNTAAHNSKLDMTLDQAIKINGTLTSIQQRLNGFLSKFDDDGTKIYEL
ncbi:DUF4145 domain-containing protein [Amylibacter sp. SFDW26]|uniref:DUF4145 domain-containing protein n=1 Tax=Amylibacter sp. SFDW26 TaxID=2652722 RepID=UPI0012626421|nr:DUF4145 domain-containing protein [Amylibacter sp. SFDW26]KAB7613703.1 DUF4145 domain-containing protein [Amylibacter sp. SFDW26]